MYLKKNKNHRRTRRKHSETDIRGKTSWPQQNKPKETGLIIMKNNLLCEKKSGKNACKYVNELVFYIHTLFMLTIKNMTSATEKWAKRYE